ncbi:MAG: ribonuclease P protein component [Anaerohalosphaeraceae bacterium]|nr:ribonuclease P protein component [Anaerohalosphaeraceae bacterium]
MGKNYFKKTAKLVKNREFRDVLSNSHSYKNDIITLHIAKNGLFKPRLGVSISRKVGSAIVRNRLKRLIREAFRQNRSDLAPNYDYLVIFSRKLAGKSKSELMKITFSEITDKFLALAAKGK